MSITLENITVTGKIVGQDFVGGLVGTGEDITIISCNFEGEIEAKNNVGGLAGEASGLIEKSSSVCDINGSSNIGGLVGSGDISIINCYSRSNLTGTSVLGGLVGNSNGASLINCYSASSINTTGMKGSLVGNNSYYVVNSCYYNQELVNSLNYTQGEGKTTEEMIFPIDYESIYLGWDFEEVWDIKEEVNEGYPFFGGDGMLYMLFNAHSSLNSLELSTAFFINLNSQTEYISEITPWFPIIRTNMVSRITNGAFASGTLLRPGPYEDELWNSGVKGFFEYVPNTQTFEDLAAQDTMPIRLPVKSAETTSVHISRDIHSNDTEIYLENLPNEWSIDSENEFKYLGITDGNRDEIIGYSQTGFLDGEYVIMDVKRGLRTSTAQSFSVGEDTVVYSSSLEMSLTWDDKIIPLGKRTEYLFRAGIEIDTKLSTTGERVTFRFYGGERKLGIDETEPLTGIGMGELFIDARDLEFEDELFDRAKLTFEEMGLEDWNLEEFKEWTWEEFKDIEIPQFETMTLAEIIKIAVGITDYTEQDLVNNYSRKEIEQIIQDKLDIVTADDINSWAFDIAKLVARLLTGEPSGAYENWTEREVKDFLITMLTNEFSFKDFEDNFPFDKWESIMKSRLELTINNDASIEVEYNQYGPYNYGVDFNLGDIIVVEYPNVFRAMIRIIEVKEEFTQEGKKYTLTLGKEFENLVSKIKADKDSISGRL
ncbi:hypothetical protein SAMN04515654_12110 [Halanaerobium congolense]|uniref:Gp28/Gp37-like domain-containing protein n=1 Tax=Halanaerobium congolense TaxID=54121 RepID=A0A1G8PRX6_9FIRM|nr:hypothetical protein [Halanaerobium congolense]SDI95231.1 hypothetical protein SAMN04515654_12110 [Halanaerobium congolense]SES89959.1 hypothetical protein SAMN04515653_10410 [Halanaerobium congolense]